MSKLNEFSTMACCSEHSFDATGSENLGFMTTLCKIVVGLMDLDAFVLVD